MEFLLTLLLLGNSCEELKYHGARDYSCYRIRERRERMAVMDLHGIWWGFFGGVFFLLLLYFLRLQDAHADLMVRSDCTT